MWKNTIELRALRKVNRMKIKEQERLEIRFGGTGGQGLVLASIILAEAMVKEGYNVIQGESHGIEARGGASRGELIAARGEIYDLSVKLPDIFVGISQEASNKYAADIRKDALVIIDSSTVKESPVVDSQHVYHYPFTSMALDELGTALPTNIIFLGALTGLSEIAAFETMEASILNRIPKGTEDVNLKAFELGYQLREEA